MIAAECFFLDVGQASAHVVDLGDGSAIVVDCGRTPHVLLELLRDHLDISRIAALVLTHNHIDHSGGMPAVLARYRKQIDFIGILQDLPAADLQQKRVFGSLEEEVSKGHAPRPTRLECADGFRYVYPMNGKPSSDGVCVEIVFPDLLQNLHSQTHSSQNARSAVLRLQCGSRKIVFPGDAELSVWKTVSQSLTTPITCDVLAVPHHGGQIVRQQRSGESDGDFYAAIRSDYDWLYRDCIRPEYAIVSAGSGNTHDHPIPVHLDALHAADAKILCTQITDRCHGSIAQLAPAVLPQSLPGHAKGSNPAVACAGTVLVQIGPDEITVDRFDDHRQEVRRKVSAPDGTPRCL